MQKKFLFIFLATIFILNKSFSKEIVLTINNFSTKDTVNLLGGPSGTFDKDPTNQEEYCQLSFVELPDKKKTTVLKLEYLVSKQGFNGYFTKLQDFDLRPYKNLEIVLKSSNPLPKLKLELKSVSEKGVYIIEKINKNFKKYVIPIDKFSGLTKYDKMKEFVIVFDGSLLGYSEGELFIKEINFVSDEKYYNDVTSKIKDEQLGIFNFIKDMSNDELLDFIQRKTFDYFIQEAGKETGFVKDRSTKDSPSSIAATGFGLAAICIGVERKWITYEEGVSIVLKTLKSILSNKAELKGFYYHFVDRDTGERVWDCELSTIDTSLLLAGIIVAREYFDEQEVKLLADKIINRVEWPWMTDKKTGLLYMGWDPENGFKNYPLWDTYAEMLVMYIMAIGAEKNSLPVEVWDKIKRPVKRYKGHSYIYSAGESMFVYQYSHAFVDFRDIQDKYANYWDNSLKAIVHGYNFCKDMADKSKTYKEYWGISASDGPYGYKNYGATIFSQDGTIAPYAICASVPFLENKAIDYLRKMILNLGTKVFGKYGFVSAINLDKNYFSDEFVGIDLGITILMIENYRTGFVWKQFMKNSIIQNGLKKIGFKPGKGELNLDELLSKEGQNVEIKLKSIEVKYLPRKIVIDGNLTEWNLSEFYKYDLDTDLEYGTVRDENDLGAEFNFYYDNKKLYFAIIVKDDVIFSEYQGKEIYLNDCVEIYFNPKGNNLFWGDKNNFQIGFSATNSITKNLSYAWFQNENPVEKNKVNFVTKKVDNGYVVEASINWEYLNVDIDKVKEIGFSVAVHDVDDNENKTDKKINFAFKNFDNKIYLGTMQLVK